MTYVRLLTNWKKRPVITMVSLRESAHGLLFINLEYWKLTNNFHLNGLFSALPCGPSIIDNQDIAHVGKMLTELNLMTYDFHGIWNEKVGVNAPLYGTLVPFCLFEQSIVFSIDSYTYSICCRPRRRGVRNDVRTRVR